MISMHAIQDLTSDDVLIIQVPQQYYSPALAAQMAEQLRKLRPIGQPPIIVMMPMGGVAQVLRKGFAEILEDALIGWEYAASYKGDFLLEKHGDLQQIATIRTYLKSIQGYTRTRVPTPPASPQLEAMPEALPLVCAMCTSTHWIPGADESTCDECGALESVARAKYERAMNSQEARALRVELCGSSPDHVNEGCGLYGIPLIGAHTLRIDRIVIMYARFLVQASAPHNPDAPPPLPQG